MRYGVASLLVTLTLVCILSPSLLFFKQVSAYTLYIMLALLVTGMFAFVIDERKLMMVSLLCCGLLNLHLKESSNKQMRLAAVTAKPSLKISHISLGNAESDYDVVINYLLGIDMDFLSFQELTPDWNAQLIEKLSPTYNHVQTLTRLDQYGMGFFSKIPFQQMDTVFLDDVPNLMGTIELYGQGKCNILSCQVVPPVSQAAFLEIDQHFSAMSKYIAELDGAMVVLGDFHLPPWSAEVQKFKLSSRLKDGRRDIHPRNIDGSLSLPKIPVEHILFSDDFECTSFSEIGNSAIGRIGISGTYQLQGDYDEMVQ